MNKTLILEIVKHIFSQFLIIDSDFILKDKSKSLKSSEFLLNKTLEFYEDDQIIYNKIWGCQLLIDNKEVKFILGDCGSEYALIIYMKDQPIYGLFYSEENSYIAFSVDKIDWVDCTTYFQATFLAGMEQLKELGFSLQKCINYEEEVNILKSFIKFIFNKEENGDT